MADNQYKRNIAYKYRIGDLLTGQKVNDGERFGYLSLDGKRIVRVNIIGNVIEKYDSEGEKKYSFLTIDDASGQIKLKSFGDDVDKLKDLNQGKTILVIGTLREFNDEMYISPEIVKEKDSKYLLIRKLETEKQRAQSSPEPQTKEEKSGVKDKIMETIKNATEGIETEHLKVTLRDISPEIIEQEIQKALEEGIIFEPRPGIIRYLG